MGHDMVPSCLHPSLGGFSSCSRVRTAARNCRTASFFGDLPKLLMHGTASTAARQKPSRSEICLQTSSTPNTHPFRVCTFNVLVSVFGRPLGCGLAGCLPPMHHILWDRQDSSRLASSERVSVVSSPCLIHTLIVSVQEEVVRLAMQGANKPAGVCCPCRLAFPVCVCRLMA